MVTPFSDQLPKQQVALQKRLQQRTWFHWFWLRPCRWCSRWGHWGWSFRASARCSGERLVRSVVGTLQESDPLLKYNTSNQIIRSLVARQRVTLVVAFSFFPKGFKKWQGPTNGTLSFYECIFTCDEVVQAHKSNLIKRIVQTFLHLKAMGTQKLWAFAPEPPGETHYFVGVLFRQ